MDYTPVPGRGLVTRKAIDLRLEYLQEQGLDISTILEHHLDYTEVQKNIESFVGTTEIPLGLVGPIYKRSESGIKVLHGLVGTLEGALVASMNRGAKAISQSGGFNAIVHRQRMVRAPLLICEDEDTALKVATWVSEHFEQIKKVTKEYSNHADLLEIEQIRDEEKLHLRFFFTTGDAAGQNMTTTCTWHALLYLVDECRKNGMNILDFVLEGNAASDKKASQFVIDKGRGTQVTASCELPESVIEHTLRTSSEQLLKFYYPSIKQAKKDGMLGYNINVANAVAGFFAASGQDLASVHESSLADLYLEKTEKGLLARLTLHSLVIGTVGGGTRVPAQKNALEFMNCYGEGKVSEFAELIAGFALGLELSTYSAMVSGQFAKAHEKLGRNKPVDWLNWSELNEEFFTKNVLESPWSTARTLDIRKGEMDNGILMNLTKQFTSKVIGFIPIDIDMPDGAKIPVLVKSKALDIEVVKGLHRMAAAVDADLSDLISKYRNQLEYAGSHSKELELGKWLDKKGVKTVPAYYGSYADPSREVFLLCQERLLEDEMLSFDSENRPEEWTDESIKAAVDAIHEVHELQRSEPLQGIQAFRASAAEELYLKMLDIIEKEYPELDVERLRSLVTDLKDEPAPEHRTLIHNDYNSRNVGIRKDGRICIYDWELAVNGYPERDVMEFLAFTLPAGFSEERFRTLVDYHFSLVDGMDKELYLACCRYAIKEFIVARILFYKVAAILLSLKFVDRVLENALRMLEVLEVTINSSLND